MQRATKPFADAALGADSGGAFRMAVELSDPALLTFLNAAESALEDQAPGSDSAYRVLSRYGAAVAGHCENVHKTRLKEATSLSEQRFATTTALRLKAEFGDWDLFGHHHHHHRNRRHRHQPSRDDEPPPPSSSSKGNDTVVKEDGGGGAGEGVETRASSRRSSASPSRFSCPRSAAVNVVTSGNNSDGEPHSPQSPHASIEEQQQQQQKQQKQKQHGGRRKQRQRQPVETSTAAVTTNHDSAEERETAAEAEAASAAAVAATVPPSA